MKKIGKIVILVLFLIFILSTIVFADNQGEDTKFKDTPQLIIGDDIDYSPYSFLNSKGEPDGFNVEIAKAVGNAMGYDVVIKLDTWSKTRDALDSGKIDVIAGMFYSKERTEMYSFTSKHSVTNGDIFTKRYIRLKSVEDLRGKTVVVQKADIVQEYLSSLNIGIKFVEVSTVEEALQQVEDGAYDYAGVLKLPGLYRIKESDYKDMQAQGIMLAPNDYCMAVKKGNEDLVLTLNGGLQVIKANGEYQRIYDKWLGVYEEKDLKSIFKEYMWVLLIIAVVVLGLLVISVSLKQMVNAKTKELLAANIDLQESLREINGKNERLIASEEELIAQSSYINFLAFHDPLTNLPNRRKFIQELEAALISGSAGAVILLDLDNFKSINDTMGHVYGDKVLVGVARRLDTIVEENIFVSRFGGDEFLILFGNEDSPDKVKKIVEKIKHIFDEKINIDENEIKITFSMGITLFPGDSREVNQLIMNADLALYEVKTLAKNSYGFFNNSLAEHLLKKTNIEIMLREAIENDGFKMVYQPQINIENGEVHAYEALLRFKENLISPAEFISVAEENGVIIKIGRIVTKKVIEQLGEWKNKGFPIKPVSINFSAMQLHDRGFIRFMTEELERNKVEAKYIEIEITENIFLQNMEQTMDFLLKMRELGIKISIDDFGTGYSSLSYLTFLPIDKIKLDRSLNNKFLEIENIKVMDSLIMLAHSLNLEVVAEGIETHEQYKKLRVGNCDYIQGYYFSLPLEVEDVERNFNYNYYDKKPLQGMFL